MEILVPESRRMLLVPLGKCPVSDRTLHHRTGRGPIQTAWPAGAADSCP